MLTVRALIVRTRGVLTPINLQQKHLWKANRLQGACPMTDSPVHPAGTIFLKCWNTSSLFDSLAFLATERINVLVSEFGFSSEASSALIVSLR